MGTLLIILKVLVLTLIVILCLILAFLLAFVLIPIYCKINLKNQEEYKAQIDISWLWRIVGLELVFLSKKKLIAPKLFGARIVTFTIKPKPPEEKEQKALEKAEKKAKKKEKKKEKKRKKKLSLQEQLGEIAAAVETLSLEAFRQLMRFLLRFFFSLKLKLSGEAEIGLTDPADMGVLLGIFYSLAGPLGITNFRLYANWREPTLKGRVTLCSRVWLLHIIAIAIRFMFASSIRRIWWPLVKERIMFWRRPRPQVAEQ